MKKVCVVGHFGFGETMLNGQTVKTKILQKELVRKLGEDAVMCIDTHFASRLGLLKLPFTLFRALKRSEHTVILPAQNGLRVIVPILSFWNRFFCRGLHYAVIGGWLAPFLEHRRSLRKQLQRFDGVYVETTTMRGALEAMGFSNAVVMPNCKTLPILSAEDAEIPAREPYRLATFSRVMREKGIEDAVNAVRSVNAHSGRTVYTLDIYGQVDGGQTEWFDALRKTFPEEIRYGGLVPFDKSVEMLTGCFALLFPTHFYTEGIPGTVIDAYAAGVPVISAKWESFADLIRDGETGIGYRFDDETALEEILRALAEHPERILGMRRACLYEAERYAPKEALRPLTDRL